MTEKVPLSSVPVLSAGAERVPVPGAEGPARERVQPDVGVTQQPANPAALGPGTLSAPALSAGTEFDVLIIGAGPSGTLTGILLARRGYRVLVVDRAQVWPREKACGGCLDAQAYGLLRRHGLAHLLTETHALSRTEIHFRGQSVHAPVAHALAVSRPHLDAALVGEFERAGGTFEFGTSAAVERGMGFQPMSGEASLEQSQRMGRMPMPRVTLSCGGVTRVVESKVVIVADGLSGTSVAHHPWAEWHVAADAHLGVAATLPDHAHLASPHTIHMHVGPEGYVGLVRLPGADGSAVLHLGAAISPEACRAQGGPGPVLRSILKSSADLTLPEALVLKGTPLLTRHRKMLGCHRVLAVGDACAYVEPFTGQGIGWALRSAHELEGLLTDEVIRQFPEAVPQLWTAHYRRVLAPQHVPCATIRRVLRNSALTSLAASLIDHLPDLPKRLTTLYQPAPVH